MSVHQHLGLLLESKVVQKLSLEKNVFTKKWSPKLIFLNEIFFWKNSVDFWHQKLTLKVRFWHFLMNCNSSTDCLKRNPLSMSILGQKSCFLGPTNFKIPQPNWHYTTHRQSFQNLFKTIIDSFFSSKKWILKAILYYQTGDEVDFG